MIDRILVKMFVPYGRSVNFNCHSPDGHVTAHRQGHTPLGSDRLRSPAAYYTFIEAERQTRIARLIAYPARMAAAVRGGRDPIIPPIQAEPPLTVPVHEQGG